MSKHASPASIGAFVVIALALLVTAILILGGGRLFRTTAAVIVYFDDSVGGLRVGAPVKFRGIEIGAVKDVRINMAGVALDPHHVRIPVVLEIDEDKLRSRGAPAADLRDPKQVQRLVDQGLRAELALDSFVTGIRYVELDIRPGTPARLVHDRTYPEIPPLQSPTEAIPGRVDQVLAKLADIDFSGIAQSVKATVDHVDQLVSSPHLARAIGNLDQLTAELDRAAAPLVPAARDLRPAIAEVKDTAASAHRATEQLSSRLDTTLRDLSGAARSLRRLADQLARDPGSILRGGKP
jgi:paraquat-inducible protein B